MGSIRENPLSARLPDLCNMGIWLRVLLAVNAGALVAALARNRELANFPAEFLELATLVEPIVLGSLTLLCAGRRVLERLADKGRAVVMILVPMLLAQAFVFLFHPLLDLPVLAWRPAFWSGIASALLLAAFDLLRRARAPAVAEARLMALTARIRPHFLFNSLNAVLGVMRSDPRRAEAALEELSELFRALMRENRDLVPLSGEIALARQYLELERLRLGERLRMRWDVERCPPEALVPPLMLQPLLENAVYHGIEPLDGGGEIAIRIDREGERIVFELANPVNAAAGHHAGNQMALANIRERLLLFFDLEAVLDARQADGSYRVRISFPFRGDRNP